jgi:hypothetical protein
LYKFSGSENIMFNVINIIPTGIGASIGGFAGDANPLNSLLETICDYVITHPNAVNAATLYTASAKTMYVEGYGLDQFIRGKWGLKRTYNKVGVIIDKKAEPYLVHIINALNACVSVYGTELTGYVITEEEIGPEVTRNEKGLFSGEVKNPETMFKAAEKLRISGANALAVFTVLENPYEEAEDIYLSGDGVDPIGRLEAIISHLLVEKTGLPCAHAPVFAPYEKVITDPRVAAEEIGFTFIPCVIRGLQHAPQFRDLADSFLTINDVNAIICPYSSMAGEWRQECLDRDIPIIAVKENTTALNDTPESLGVESKIIVVENYLETLGVLLAIKAGINYKSLRRPLDGIKKLK